MRLELSTARCWRLEVESHDDGGFILDRKEQLGFLSTRDPSPQILQHHFENYLHNIAGEYHQALRLFVLRSHHDYPYTTFDSCIYFPSVVLRLLSVHFWPAESNRDHMSLIRTSQSSVIMPIGVPPMVSPSSTTVLSYILATPISRSP